MARPPKFPLFSPLNGPADSTNYFTLLLLRTNLKLGLTLSQKVYNFVKFYSCPQLLLQTWSLTREILRIWPTISNKTVKCHKNLSSLSLRTGSIAN